MQGDGNDNAGENNPHQRGQDGKPLGQPLMRMDITVPHGNRRNERPVERVEFRPGFVTTDDLADQDDDQQEKQ